MVLGLLIMSDYRFINEQGLIIPDTSALRAQVISDFQAAFGADIDTDPSSPSGLLITMHTEMRDAVARNNAELANQINPDIATGVFLDAIFALTDPQGRKPAIKSMINGVTLTGQAGTIVPAGTVCAALDGSQWALVQQVKIGQGGTATGDFIATEYGSIDCQPHQLQTIVTGVLGLTAIDNLSGAIIGRDAESDVTLRRRRRMTLATQSMSTPEAIRSRLSAIESVRSLSFLENISNTQQTIRGIVMAPHSIWVCVEGGTDQEVAQALFDSKTAGAGYNGNVTVNIVDPRSQVTYPVMFDRPDEVQLLIRATVKPSSLDAVGVIPQLVMNYVNGELEGDASFVVGSDVSPWEISGAINQQEPRLSVTNVELSLAGSGVWSSAVYPIAINEVARTQANSITVVVA